MHSFDPLENSTPVATKPARRNAVKPAAEAPECELVHLDERRQCGCLCIRGVPYFIGGEVDEAEVLVWTLTRRDKVGKKIIQVVDAAGDVSCDCESQTYRQPEGGCKHIRALRRFALVSADATVACA